MVGARVRQHHTKFSDGAFEQFRSAIETHSLQKYLLSYSVRIRGKVARTIPSNSLFWLLTSLLMSILS